MSVQKITKDGKILQVAQRTIEDELSLFINHLIELAAEFEQYQVVGSPTYKDLCVKNLEEYALLMNWRQRVIQNSIDKANQINDVMFSTIKKKQGKNFFNKKT
jgi:hypothetical protein